MDSYTTLDIFVADCIVADIHRSLVQIRLEGILYFLTFLNAELFERIYTTYSTIQKMFRPIHLQKNISFNLKKYLRCNPKIFYQVTKKI